jgi:hypothetical protein
LNVSKGQFEIARALAQAFDPLVAVCLQIGITSPELESLLRAQFVQYALAKLPRHPNSGRRATVSRVSIATGVHRDVIAKIQRSGTLAAVATVEKKQRLHSKGSRVLLGWTTDLRFRTSSGEPLDLPIEANREKRSFEDLVRKYAPSTAASTVLKELRRLHCVDVLDGDLVRFRSMTPPRKAGFTKSNVAQASRRLKRFGDTLYRRLSIDGPSSLYAETKTVRLSVEHLGLVFSTVERRAKDFLEGVESELETRSAARPRGKTKRLGFAVHSFEEDD